jgi:hypothetical protein
VSVAQLVGTEYLLVGLLLLAVAVVTAAFGLSVYRQKPAPHGTRPRRGFMSTTVLVKNPVYLPRLNLPHTSPH